MISLLYVARLRQALPTSSTGEGAEFRVFTSALILAQKYHTDDRYSNKTWAKFTGLPLIDINTMEREFLGGVGGRLHVRREEYERWLKSVQVLGQEFGRVGVVRCAEVEQGMGVVREEREGEAGLGRSRSWPESERHGERGVGGGALDRSPPRSREV
ncbi:hypothetical protein HDV00_000714 [Rhizophlyctis rosea]|nr:hypothetical protein HDV00_000714 [Rhizophlyctis rosea]